LILFTSKGSTLVPGDTNQSSDTFVRDVELGLTRRVSLSVTNSEIRGDTSAGGMSADGRHIVYLSNAYDVFPGLMTKSTEVFLKDLTMGTLTRVTSDMVAALFYAWISPDGNSVAWLGVDRTGAEQEGIYTIYDAARKASMPVVRLGSRYDNGANGSFSADGKYFVFDGHRDSATDSVGPRGVFVLDRSSGQITRVGVASGGLIPNGECSDPDISSDGRIIAFISNAKNLGEGSTGRPEPRIFNRATGTFLRVPGGNDGAYDVSLSADGKLISVRSRSTDLTTANTGGLDNIFVAAVPTTP
jgi:Tol biopolymer transport system component